MRNVFTNSQESPVNMALVFNKDTYAVKQTSIVFFDVSMMPMELIPDPKKGSVVHKMPTPKTATQLQKFLGLVAYLSPFNTLTLFLHHTLHGLLKKWTEFIWNNSQQEAFDKVKSMVCKDTTLWNVNVGKSVTVQSWYIPKRPRCCPPSRWLPSFQGSYAYGVVLCQHRM